jgi:DNA primase
MINLYNNLDIATINDPYVNALSFKTGNPIKYFNLNNDFKLLQALDESIYKKEQYFFLSNKEVLLIPIEFIDGSIYAIHMRSVHNKKFWNVKFNEIPLMYGLNDFQDFKYGSPVVLCEGSKDVQTIKLLYKYVIAYLTASPGNDIIDYLKKISNKILIIGDADKAGRNLKWKDYLIGIKKSYLSKKDAGYYWDVDFYTEFNEEEKKKQKNLILKNIEIILKKEGIL